MFDNAYIFGSSANVSYLFDLRTYGEVDTECDIYAVEVFKSTPYRIGRSFFEFVQGYCIGTEIDQFQELLRIIVPNDWESRADWESDRHPGIFCPMPLF